MTYIEICECGGQATVCYIDDISKVPVLKCEGCGDKFEAWTED